MDKLIASIAILSIVFSTISCSRKKDPVEYNNEVITIVNGGEKHINAMNTAMINKNYDDAAKIQKEWKEAVDEDIKKLKKIGDFNDDNQLQQAVLEGLKGYKKIVEEDYPKLIDIRKDNTADIDTERVLLDNINDAFEKMAHGANQASNQFTNDHLTSK